MFSYPVTASPTVSLERGDYRMRAPPRRPPPLLFKEQVRPPPRGQHHDVSRRITLLLLFLVVAALSCFGAAYYLFAARWEQRTASFHSTETNPSHKANAMALGIDPHQKFISYLPHSGFHNQRIAFENALVLAFALRRTLLVPPIRLANKPIRYVEFDTLVRHHELASKEGLHHCPRLPPYLSRPLECLDYFESSYLPWSWLVDLSAPARQSRIIQLPNVSQRSLRRHLNLEERDIYNLKDRSPYQFRFLDSKTDVSLKPDRYAQVFHFSDLAIVNTRLLQLGTLFGTSRLRLRDPVNLAYQRVVRQTMIFTNQNLSQVADSITRSLGGRFLAAHIRLGDGYFKADADQTIKSIWWSLILDVLGFSPIEACHLQLEQSGFENFNCLRELTCTGNCSLFTTVSDIRLPVLRSTCRFPRHPKGPYELLNIPLYVATDLQHPESDNALHLLRQTFPCIFFLADFPQHIRTLGSLTSPYDGVPLQPFLLPFIDAMVAAKALGFVGTRGSTFSKFVTTLWHFHHEEGTI